MVVRLELREGNEIDLEKSDEGERESSEKCDFGREKEKERERENY